MRSYFTTHLSFNLLMKEFLKLVNNWQITRKMVIVSRAPFALHFCHQRCWSCQISYITCVLQTETVANHCYVSKQVNVSLLSTNIKLLLDQFLLTDWQTDAISDRLTADHVWHFAATAFLCCVSCVQRVMGFLYDRCKQLFVSELTNAYFSNRHLF